MDATWVRRVWEKRGIFCCALWIVFLPFSFLYGLAIQIRNLLYSLRWLTIQSLPRVVVSVGNLTVGGTGKTPTTIWLAGELRRQGHRVAILSRGYKRAGKGTVILEPAAEPPPFFGDKQDLLAAGDEPVMMARVFGQRVGVGKSRHEVGSRMLSESEVDVFILDDGFQHRQLNRDIDLLLLGSDWNGWLIPAGPFREPRRSLSRANFYLVTGSREKWQRFLAGRPRGTIFFGALQPKALLTLMGGQWKEYPLSLMGRSKILAVSAVADPTPFYRMIHDWEGEIVDAIEFPDHRSYSSKDWQRISRAARYVDFILTTEKDIMKLARFPFAMKKLLALRVEMVVEDGNALIKAVEEAIRGRQGTETKIEAERRG